MEGEGSRALLRVSPGRRDTSVPTASGLIGLDLGPKPSITGSRATILWLVALRLV
jgi:hypothetical protein